MPSLDDAYEKLARGRKRLTELKSEIDAAQVPHFDIITLEQNRRNPNQFQYSLPNPLRQISVSVGEIANHFRSPLDYLVKALVEFNNHVPTKRTQFLIVDKPEDFKSGINVSLKGLAVEHRARIEQLQPYKGCHWTGLLKDLSNIDKHTGVIYLIATGGSPYHASAIVEYTNSDLVRLPNGVSMAKTMKVKSHLRGSITLRNGSPVIEALQILQTEVASVLDEFKPLFEDF